MNLLLLKLTLIPGVIALVTLAIRKWGNKIGGLIGSMPWTAGPILLFFILEQGKAFGIQSIQGAMTGILALISFCLSYSSFSRKLPWSLTLLLSYGLYALTALLFNYLRLSLPVSYLLVISYVLLALRFFPIPTRQTTAVRRLPFDILIRMLVATVFVLVITGLASILGPNWSGILTPFPIMTSVLAIFSHTLQGSGAAITTLRGHYDVARLGYRAVRLHNFSLLASLSVAAVFGSAVVWNCPRRKCGR